MESAIDIMEKEVWACCVRQRAAKGDATIARWQKDEYAHLKERYIVEPMPDTMQPLVEKALAEWQKIENAFCAAVGMSPDEFLEAFEKARESFLMRFDKRDGVWQRFITNGNTLQGRVRNMDWVNLFAWVLPQADPANRERNIRVGKMVTACLYTEYMFKYALNVGASNEPLRLIEARWKLVSEKAKNQTLACSQSG